MTFCSIFIQIFVSIMKLSALQGFSSRNKEQSHLPKHRKMPVLGMYSFSGSTSIPLDKTVYITGSLLVRLA